MVNPVIDNLNVNSPTGHVYVAFNGHNQLDLSLCNADDVKVTVGGHPCDNNILTGFKLGCSFNLTWLVVNGYLSKIKFVGKFRQFEFCNVV